MPSWRRITPVRAARLPRALLVLLAGASVSGASLPARQETPPPQSSVSRPAAPQPSKTSAEAAARATERIAALQREADALAKEERGLLVDLRRLEVERDLRLEEARRADARVEGVNRQIQDTTAQIASIQAAIEAARPALEARLVHTYKLGRPGYARLLLSVDSLQEMARASRMVAALAQLDERRLAEHAAAVERLRSSRATLDRQWAEVRGLQAEARQASSRAQVAAATREALVRQIDSRRDFNAKMVAELEAVRDRLTKAVAALPPSSAEDPTLLPLRPFRGALPWPASGVLASRFGQVRNPRFGTTTLQNGIEIAAAEGSRVTAVHEGRVAFAGVFAGFGQLVIVDHGALAYSLYGFLSSMATIKGARVAGGQPLGTVGRAPAGRPALYFELRVDGKPVDPVQWLKAKY